MSRVVIDAANLHVGGGVQVASAFISDVMRMSQLARVVDSYPWITQVEILASAEVQRSLADPRAFNMYNARARPEPSGTPDVEFVVFGPRYRRSRASRTLMGFADVTSIYPRPTTVHYKAWPPATLRRKLSLRSFARAHHIVVETAAVKTRLAERGFATDALSVVSNTVHPTILSAKPRDVTDRMPLQPTLLYVARGYPHKNHDFLGRVGWALEHRHGIRVRFIVTLTPDEWRERSTLFQRYAESVGEVTVRQLPALYRRVDAAIFPSLLECFSAAPLEALRMRVPIAGSDRDFIKSTCGDAVHYFDPFEPNDAAECVAQMLNDDRSRASKIAVGQTIVNSLPSSEQRSGQYLCLIDRLLKDTL